MTKDVEFNVTANDKVGSGLASAEAKFKASQKRIEDNQKNSLGTLAKGVVTLAESVSPKLASSLGKAFAGGADALGPALIAGAAVAAPLIGATVAAAIAAGVGVGVAGIGVALVAQDARVKAAGDRLGKSLISGLEQDASPFIGPVLAAIDTIQAKFTALRPVIQRIFGNAAAFVQPLVAGATRAIDGILRGVDILVAKSQPVIDILGDAIGDLGVSFGDFLASIDVDSAATSLKKMADAAAGLLEILGPVLNILSKIYNFADSTGLTSFVGLLSDFGNKTDKTAKSTDNLTESFQGASDATADFTANVKTSDEAIAADKAAKDAVFTANRALYSSTTQVAQAFADATKAAKENGSTLSTNTAKGRANRDVLASLADTLNGDYKAFVKVNGEGGKSSALAQTLRDRFVKLAEKMGAASGTANDLADDLLGIPSVNPKIKVNPGPAQQAARDAEAALNRIHDRTVSVNVQFNQGRINKVQAQLARLGGTAFDANDSFGMTGGGDSTSRTGGPSQISVNQSLSVNLDGAPFRSYTAKQLEAERDRNAWRSKVGSR